MLIRIYFKLNSVMIFCIISFYVYFLTYSNQKQQNNAFLLYCYVKQLMPVYSFNNGLDGSLYNIYANNVRHFQECVIPFKPPFLLI